MAAKRKKAKVVQPVAYKRAVARIETYKEAVKSGKELQSEIIEKFEADIAPFLTKKGELKKRISQKRLKEFNKIVSDFKKTNAATAKAARNKLDRTVKKAVEHGKYTKEESKQVLTAFAAMASQELSKKRLLDSDQVIQLAQTYKSVTRDDFEKLAKYIKNRYEDLPEELRNRSETSIKDDNYEAAERLLQDIEAGRIDWDILEAIQAEQIDINSVIDNTSDIPFY